MKTNYFLKNKKDNNSNLLKSGVNGVVLAAQKLYSLVN